MNNDNSLSAFKAVCSFVSDLALEFGDKHKPLRLFQRLIEKTQITNDQIIKKYLTIFKEFCVKNRESISEQKELAEKVIQYNEKIYINMGHIFNIANEECTKIIWQHLLTISAFLDPVGNARALLKKLETKDEINVDTSDLPNSLTGIIADVEKKVGPNATPSDVMKVVMESGMISKVMDDMSSGKLDLGKIMGMVSGMMAGSGVDPAALQGMGNMLGGLFKGVGGNPSIGGSTLSGSSVPSQTPSLGSAETMNMLSGLMSSLSAGAMSANSENETPKEPDTKNGSKSDTQKNDVQKNDVQK